jgi:hypothetical protein
MLVPMRKHDMGEVFYVGCFTGFTWGETEVKSSLVMELGMGGFPNIFFSSVWKEIKLFLEMITIIIIP